MSDPQKPIEETAAAAEEIEGAVLESPDDPEPLEFDEDATDIAAEEKRLGRELTRREKNKINGNKGGRPRGSMTRTAKERKEALEAYKNRVAGNMDMLLDGQLTAARGMSFLYRIDTVMVGKRKERKPAVLVEDPNEIKDYLDGEYDGEEDTYYFITTKAPDQRAIDSMQDRTYGRSAQSIDLKDDEGNSILFLMAQAALKAGVEVPVDQEQMHEDLQEVLADPAPEAAPVPAAESAAAPASMLDAAKAALSPDQPKNEAPESPISPAEEAAGTKPHDESAAA